MDRNEANLLGKNAVDASTSDPAPAVATLEYRGVESSTRTNPLWALLRIPEVGVLVPLIGLTVLFALINPALIVPNSVASMLRAMAFVGIIAIGQTMLMIAGELDLSVGWVAGLSGVVAGMLIKDHHWAVPAGLLAGVAVGALAGLVNGLAAVKIGLPAFIATLGMFYIAKGVAYTISGGIPVYPLPDSIANFGARELLGVSHAFWIFIALAIGAEFILRKTTFGRAIYATGGNAEVARLAGIRTSGIKIICYVLTGALSGVAGLLLMAEIATAAPDSGQGWELAVIASVVIGGVSLFGGQGTVIGTFLGLLVMQIVRSGLATSGLKSHWQTTAVGVIMMVAVSLDLLRRRTKTS